MTTAHVPLSTSARDAEPAERRWSARRTLAFAVLSSLALWAGIIAILGMAF